MNIYSVARRTDPKDPGWELFLSTRRYGGQTLEPKTWCQNVFLTREEAVGHLFEILPKMAGVEAVYVQDVTDYERGVLGHPSNKFSLLEEMPEGVATFIALAEIVNNL